jgi:hypothetical protein
MGRDPQPEPRLVTRYLRALLKHGWLLLVAAVGLLGDLATAFGAFDVPRWVWYVVFAGGVVGAQFLAYRDAVRDRDRLDARLEDTRRDRDDVRAERDEARRARDVALENALRAYPQHIIENQRVYLPDLVRNRLPPILERLVFVECELYGPVVAIFDACQLNDPRWFGIGENMIWPRERGRGLTQGAIVFKECSFNRCRFEGVGVASYAEPQEIEEWKRIMGLDR